MRQIIIDTDIDTDCDDAGALAVLHGLATAGECEILGIVCSVPIESCPGAVRSINAWYGRANLRVGWIGGAGRGDARWSLYRAHRSAMEKADGGLLYNDRLAAGYPVGDYPPEPAVLFYRRLLAEAADRSITICAVGTLTALACLLESEPDDYCPLSGVELVGVKVRELVSMAKGTYPDGAEGFNWKMDFPAAATVFERWPTTITVSPHGDNVHTGKAFVARSPVEHPVRAAYVRFLGGEGRSRSSWDQIAVLYAVRELGGPFALSGPRRLALDRATYRHSWTPAEPDEPARRLVVPIVSDEQLAVIIEELML